MNYLKQNNVIIIYALFGAWVATACPCVKPLWQNKTNKDNQMKEIWKDIPNYEGYYQISNKGRIKSLKRFHGTSKKIIYNEKILKFNYTMRGYYVIMLYSKNLKRKNFFVSRLVAQAFIPNPGNKPQVNHIDGIKSHNYTSNLEWNTNRENMDHAIKTGLILKRKGEDNPSSKLTNNQVKEIRKKYNKTSLTQRQIGEKYNVKNNTISNILNNKTYKGI